MVSCLVYDPPVGGDHALYMTSVGGGGDYACFALYMTSVGGDHALYHL